MTSTTCVAEVLERAREAFRFHARIQVWMEKHRGVIETSFFPQHVGKNGRIEEQSGGNGKNL